MAHLYIAAAQKSSGKTTLSIGLCRAWRDAGVRIQPFKKGPDYIDPLWLTEASSRSCCNLDFHTMGREEIRDAFARELDTADLGLIEGNVGLFDSIDPTGSNSNAELAKLLGAPVVLVINAQGMGRGIVPLLLGYQAFDRDLNLAGVILNKVGGTRHARNLIAALEHYTDLPVLGVMHRDDDIEIAERHLGLMPSNEAEAAEAWIERIRGRVAEQVDLSRMLAIAEGVPRPSPIPCVSSIHVPAGDVVRIGVARDAAFGFYYPDDLRALADAGAELVEFSPLADRTLPALDALYIGGGFPECRMAELEANRGMREEIADFIARGGPVYAECGGLMYLCEAIDWNGERRAMVGALEAEVRMHPRAQGRGYVRLRETSDFPWPDGAVGAPCEIPAHEFHHSAVVAPDPSWRYGYDVLRGVGIDGAHDGVVQGHLLACYSHLRDVGGVGWTRRFVAHVRRCLGG
ncbi:cobyrinate a,c-diamide synthase [Thiocapsa rosea]|uniref:Cobyrinate a,c-diamide synthase n=1 Tax=Thiocapsa rosea TaxID=69360 RepID=A0A495V8V4_9GAMM|nr:cobyrinate a,c-diamide synthase [Thiocapsa rosea]RKT45724.1 hydrogenobyrinic acid a,c-diamide synthase (glutamine-hydrolysing) /cobyrinate a,c-diamide synthase [Thiocapsa rosea]